MIMEAAMNTSDTIQQAQQAGDLAAEIAAIAGESPSAAYRATVTHYLDNAWGKSAATIAAAQAAGNAAHEAAPMGEKYDAYRKAFDEAMRCVGQ